MKILPKMSDPAAMKIELWDIEKVVPYPQNAKKHPPEQIKRLAAHIKRLGWDQPIVVDKDGVIIKGHGRRLAAVELGLKKVPVLCRSDLTKEEADAARIGDNAVSSTEYDTKMLQEELHRLMAIDDLTFTVDDLGLADKDKQLLLDALDVPEATAIMEDTHGEIEEQKRQDAERVEKTDKDEVKLAEAFGFKTVTRDQGRVIARFLAEAEAYTHFTGAEAFTSWLESKLQ